METLDRQTRADRILTILEERFPSPPVPLDHGNPFQLLVAVILSAQCTDARVNLVTPALFAVAPDAKSMAELGARRIKPFIKTCGLAGSKAKAIAEMSRIVDAKYGGEIPRSLELLEQLPGVGHKTASVVMIQAFREPTFPVDTHIHRLAGRWRLSRARNVVEVERDLKKVFPRDRWVDLHLQLIYAGRAFCTAKAHQPDQCPICSWAMSKARAKAEKRQGISKPVKPAKKKPAVKDEQKQATPVRRATRKARKKSQ